MVRCTSSAFPRPFPSGVVPSPSLPIPLHRSGAPRPPFAGWMQLVYLSLVASFDQCALSTFRRPSLPSVFFFTFLTRFLAGSCNHRALVFSHRDTRFQESELQPQKRQQSPPHRRKSAQDVHTPYRATATTTTTTTMSVVSPVVDSESRERIPQERLTGRARARVWMHQDFGRLSRLG